MKESDEQRKNRLRKTVIIRHRRNKNLCEQCGLEKHEGLCVEDYTKTDMRDIPIKPKTLDLKRKKDTIISYRKKKLLCLKCGLEKHEGLCIENYDKSDNRTAEDKKRRPAVVKTPKSKSESILHLINNKKELQIKLKPDKKIVLHRPFITINLEKSKDGNIVELSCITQLARKFRDHIVCVIGSFEKNFPCSDLLKLKKVPAIYELKTGDIQTVINYIASSDKFFSYNCDLTDFCKHYKFRHYIFDNGKNATNFLKDIAYYL